MEHYVSKKYLCLYKFVDKHRYFLDTLKIKNSSNLVIALIQVEV